jgi:uncharacterized membrane protein YgdD (TMEM256/DUF423 family)
VSGSQTFCGVRFSNLIRVLKPNLKIKKIKNMNKFFLQTGIILAGLSVAIGAFGAHSFKAFLELNNQMNNYETAARYQMYGGLALILTGILTERFKNKFMSLAGQSFVLGTIIFAGALYLICGTGIKMFGAIAPIGGTGMICGWIFLFLGVQKED